MTTAAEELYGIMMDELRNPTPPEPLSPVSKALVREFMQQLRVDPLLLDLTIGTSDEVARDAQH
jgi:hypothetical protein